jgi:uncharacterized protein
MPISTLQQPGFQVIIKPVGPHCDLNCRYCYYLEKKDLFPGELSRMKSYLLEELTRQYLDVQQSDITFIWQGGEPTLAGIDFFREALFFQEKFNKSGKRLSNTIQTHGMHLDRDWAQFLKEHHFLVGVSVDGPAAIHDYYRTGPGVENTFSRVMEGFRFLREFSVPFNVLTCVHAANINHPREVYRFLRDELGARHLQFIPVVRMYSPSSGGDIHPAPFSITGEKYGRFLISIFDEWIKQDVGKVFVQIFEAVLARWIRRPGGVCVFQETCGDALVMEHNGDVYSCDHFVNPEHFLGNIRETPLSDLARSSSQVRFGQIKMETLPEICLTCEFRFLCGGGCPKNRFPTGAEKNQLVNSLCEGYRNFFSHTKHNMLQMAELISRGQPASRIITNAPD